VDIMGENRGYAAGPDFAIIDQLNETVQTTVDTDTTVTMVLQGGFTGTLPGDITWSFDVVFAGLSAGYTPTVVANGPAVSDGFTIQWRPGSSPNGTLAGAQWNVRASINGGVNRDSGTFFCTTDSYAVEWLSVPADVGSPLQYDYLGTVPGQYGTYLNVSGPGSITLYARGNLTAGEASIWTVNDVGTTAGDFGYSTRLTINADDTCDITWGGTPGTLSIQAQNSITGELAPPPGVATYLQIIIS
jgi:hypothetical protein